MTKTQEKRWRCFSANLPFIAHQDTGVLVSRKMGKAGSDLLAGHERNGVII